MPKSPRRRGQSRFSQAAIASSGNIRQQLFLYVSVPRELRQNMCSGVPETTAVLAANVTSCSWSAALLASRLAVVQAARSGLRRPESSEPVSDVVPPVLLWQFSRLSRPFRCTVSAKPVHVLEAAFSSRLRWYSQRNSLNRPSPPSLPRAAQREFEELVRTAQAPLQQPAASAEAELTMHPDAREPLLPQFVGETNPATGERGGPKREPVGKWVDSEGDWSFKGRVSDF
ncbi:uncharacterized protein FIBRA_03160 [Fibroporia radiculosa]|uniref:Succinate dehydrogenase assembly factor 4, mitochondrial n=1 Tax=Fibroporia radiculosa TaxID=599839 RepID=J4HVU3_9APHY|nr:uncharacterized protein FIBRA_03160 [Fibroporia radiculosa]CCM01112.1 predicted protein [Fibroporia radiculosa]